MGRRLEDKVTAKTLSGAALVTMHLLYMHHSIKTNDDLVHVLPLIDCPIIK